MPDFPSAEPASFHLKTIKTINHPGWLESHVTLGGPVDAESFQQAREQLPGGAEATVLGVDLFGTEPEITGMEDMVKRAGITAPATSVISSSPGRGGMQFTAATGIDPTPLILRGRLSGYLIEDSETSRCFLGGLRPDDPDASREDQTKDVFLAIEKAVALAGMGFEHVVRTWFYNEKILDWYREFNKVRTGFFRGHAIRRMPVSTGIGAPNPGRTALVAKAFAVRSRTSEVLPRPSPLQCHAFSYGSAFSRALEVPDSCSRALYVSGTASIGPDGESIHKGDPARQIERAMDVVRAILTEAGMRLEDTTRAIAYFRDPSHVAVWEKYCCNLPPLPLVSLGCHVCRDDLLFEIELDVSAREGPPG